MNAIRATAKLNERELELVTPPSASWHRDYDDTAFVYIGGLDTRLSEGDVLTIFSQYGEPVFINLVRDKETGKSKGFCFLKYEDQRSCALAVDNLGGAMVLGRVLRVDHTRYKAKDGEEIFDNTHGETAPGQNSRAEETGSESEEEEEPARPLLKEEIELRKLLADEDDDDPMREFMIQQKREEVEKAIKEHERREKKMHKKERRHEERRRRHGNEEGNGNNRRRHDHDHDRREKKRRDDSEDDRRRSERPRRHSPSDDERERRRDR